MFMRWMLLLLAFVLVVATAQAKDHTEPIPTPPPIPVNVTVHVEQPEKKPNYDQWIAWATIALAIVTGALWCATYKLAREAKDSGTRQDKALREIERAYLFVEVSMDGILSGSPTGLTNNIRVKIWNYGKTPAEIIQIRAYPFIAKVSPTALEDYPGSNVTLPPGLAIAQNNSFDIDLSQKVTDADLNDILHQQRTLYCLGLVRYRDIFGTEQETGFCWFYSGMSLDMKFLIDPTSGLNIRT